MAWRSGGAWARRQRHSPVVVPGIDYEMQHVVLSVVLREYPLLFHFRALAAVLFENPNSLVAGIVLARAVRDLVGEQLLYSNGIYVMPTPPALHIKRLNEPAWGRMAWL